MASVAFSPRLRRPKYLQCGSQGMDLTVLPCDHVLCRTSLGQVSAHIGPGSWCPFGDSQIRRTAEQTTSGQTDEVESGPVRLRVIEDHEKRQQESYYCHKCQTENASILCFECEEVFCDACGDAHGHNENACGGSNRNTVTVAPSIVRDDSKVSTPVPQVQGHSSLPSLQKIWEEPHDTHDFRHTHANTQQGQGHSNLSRNQTFEEEPRDKHDVTQTQATIQQGQGHSRPPLPCAPKCTKNAEQLTLEEEECSITELDSVGQDDHSVYAVVVDVLVKDGDDSEREDSALYENATTAKSAEALPKISPSRTKTMMAMSGWSHIDVYRVEVELITDGNIQHAEETLKKERRSASGALHEAMRVEERTAKVILTVAVEIGAAERKGRVGMKAVEQLKACMGRLQEEQREAEERVASLVDNLNRMLEEGDERLALFAQNYEDSLKQLQQDQERVMAFKLSLRAQDPGQLFADVTSRLDVERLFDVIKRLYFNFHVRLLGVNCSLSFLFAVTVAQWECVVEHRLRIQKILEAILLEDCGHVVWNSVSRCGQAHDVDMQIGQPVPNE
ncbi:hypothetical protein BaRGS_00035279, partial [Batillaria attramentaria]